MLMYLTDKNITKLVCEELKKKDVLDMLKNDKDAEKHIRNITKEVIKDMFKVLWLHNNIFNGLTN